MIKFLDYILMTKKSSNEKIEAAKCLDKNGSGQINTGELLSVLKKRLKAKDY
jgi:Ca2+-binding EF-hand superfamily protein